MSAVLTSALAGDYAAWQWRPGLTPSVVGSAFDGLTHGPAYFHGEVVTTGGVRVPSQPYSVFFRWSADGELVIVQLSEPAMPVPWDDLRQALGEPDDVHPHGAGALPGADQWCWYDRGLTVFDSGDLGIQGIWLYRPTTAEEYGDLTGAFDPVQRSRS